MRGQQTIFRHAGYEMRSHSETRWAAIMDALHICWLYEPRTINTRHGWYLPDFFLPACGVFIEVKGPSPDLVEIQKATDVEQATGFPVIFAHGDPVMLCGELFHGALTYYASKGAVNFSTIEIGALVQKHYGLHAYCDYLRAGDRQKRPDAVHASDVLSEWLDSQLGRDALEQSKRERHTPLNEAKQAIHTQASLAEWLVSEFARAVDAHNHKDAA